MEQIRFMNIERVKFGDKRTSPNISSFEVGDIIQITEKWDGSNASIRYDAETGKLVAFSRNLELSVNQTLKGFWDYVQKLNPDDYKNTPNYVIFGEWGIKNAISYRPEFYKNWYVYDIYDVEKEEYLLQTEVKKFVKEHGLTYIHVLYEGEFVSWKHCKTFCNSPAYGEIQEGIVIKNQTKLNNKKCRNPVVLKIVNDCFSEIQENNYKKNIETPTKDMQKEYAIDVLNTVVTKQRVKKELYKMRDEGIISEKIEKNDMKNIFNNLPKRIYEDCLKEEKELVETAGVYFEKLCTSKVMRLAKEIILHNDINL